MFTINCHLLFDSYFLYLFSDDESINMPYSAAGSAKFSRFLCDVISVNRNQRKLSQASKSDASWVLPVL